MNPFFYERKIAYIKKRYVVYLFQNLRTQCWIIILTQSNKTTKYRVGLSGQIFSSEKKTVQIRTRVVKNLQIKATNSMY